MAAQELGLFIGDRVLGALPFFWRKAKKSKKKQLCTSKASTFRNRGLSEDNWGGLVLHTSSGSAHGVHAPAAEEVGSNFYRNPRC
jgi:hypothetical protein